MFSFDSFRKKNADYLKDSYERCLSQMSEEYLKYCNITYEKYSEFIYLQYKKGSMKK